MSLFSMFSVHIHITKVKSRETLESLFVFLSESSSIRVSHMVVVQVAIKTSREI